MSQKFWSGMIVAPGTLPPATLMRMSTRPNFATTSSAMRDTSAVSITLQA